MTKPIVGSIIVYVVQLVDGMICTNVLIEKVSCMCLIGFLWVCTIVLCICARDIGDALIGK